jgi:hypothetical protein
MSHAGASVRRLLLIALVLSATLCAQSAALTEEQESHHGSDHCCGLCHMGPAPVLPAVARVIVAPVFSPVWIAASVLVHAPHEVLVASAASRAPPA